MVDSRRPHLMSHILNVLCTRYLVRFTIIAYIFMRFTEGRMDSDHSWWTRIKNFPF